MKYLPKLLLSLSLFISTSAFAFNHLKIATIIEPPFSMVEADKLVGFHTEVAKVLATSIDHEAIFIQCPFARCLTLLEQGKADLMIGLRKLPVREKTLIFIEPALLVQKKPLRFYTLASKNTKISNLKGLENILVGIIRGASYFPAFDNSTNIKKVDFTSREQLVSMLLKGRIDTFLEREESIEPLLTQQEYKNKIALAEYQYDIPVSSYIAMSKKSHIVDKANELSIQLSKLIKTGVIEQLKVLHLPPATQKQTTEN